MSSLYVHIPFCRQACYYCDFHFSTNTQLKQDLIKAICQEIALQKDYLNQKHLKSIYFGGGTPSILEKNELEKIFATIAQFFSWDKDTEITLEANPDDLNCEKLKDLLSVGINRLSIGTQSFDENHLRFLNRIHSAQEAEISILTAQEIGFENISIDLIYAIPATNHTIWEKDLEKTLALQVPHISAYCLTIEPKTVFGHRLAHKQMPPIDDHFASEQLQILLKTLQKAGYEHYEISNFAKNQKYSIHNTNYWQDGEYLGVGPSAHSYNGNSRQYNIANNAKYIAAINEGRVPATIEMLSWQDKLNEYLLTGLRTQWGCKWKKINNLSKINFSEYQSKILEKYRNEEMLIFDEEKICLTEKGKFFADQIASDLFMI
jgi:oxygen-independent coproporphyrinogen-3 oxidase